MRLVRALNRASLRRLTEVVFALWWEHTVRSWMDYAVFLFSRHAIVATDRLHTHILACLMDRPSIAHDGSYSKNSRYLHAWTGTSPQVRGRTGRLGGAGNAGCTYG